MKIKSPRAIVAWVVSAMILCVISLHAQTPPTITNQPVSQTNLTGTTVSFSVTANGTGPFTYQWQLNGTNLPNNLITTVAGNGSTNAVGDSGQATSSGLWQPTGVAIDAFGNLYVADRHNNRIRKVDTNGIITTVAGNGTGGYGGDGGPATNASLYFPSGVALDTPGNLYIADLGNNLIREVGTNGIITTVAGNGTAAYAGDGGAATNASLVNPAGVTLDAWGDLYIADLGNNCIREVGANGIITTVAGNGSFGYAGDGGAATNASLANPNGVTVDAGGDLYIADKYNSRIRRVDTNGIITTMAGNGSRSYAGDGGAATNASLENPGGVTLNAYGDLYIADTYNQRVRKVDTSGTITTVAGDGIAAYGGDNGAATNGSLAFPAGLALDAFGNLYVADSTNNRVRKVWFYASNPALVLPQITADNSGNYTVVITGPNGSVTSSVASLTVIGPPGITVQPVSQIVPVGSNPGFSVTAASVGPFDYAWYFGGTNLVQDGALSTLTLSGVTTNNAGAYTVVVTNAYGSVTSQVATLMMQLPPTVTIQPVNQTNLAGTTVTLTAMASGAGPYTYYQWQLNGTNLPNGIITTVAGGGSGSDGGPATNASLFVPKGTAFDGSGNLYIADWADNRVRRVGVNGIITTVAGNGGGGYSGDGRAATNTTVQPFGVAFDAFGNLYIADQGNGRIRRVGTNGIITTAAGGGSFGGGIATSVSLNNPDGVTFDSAGNYYIADAGHDQVHRVDTNGILTTVAGVFSSPGFAGDNNLAVNASLDYPEAVAFDGSGNLYIDDADNYRVRRVDTNGIITTVAGDGNLNDAHGFGGPATNAYLPSPVSIAIDPLGNLYIADQDTDRIRMVNNDGIISTVAGYGNGGDGGPATSASLNEPTGVSFDSYGNLYFSDSGNNRVRKVSLYASYPTLTLGNLTANNAGNYSVVVSNAYGKATSAVATLTVIIPPPQIIVTNAGFGFLTNHFGFNVTGVAGQTIIVDGSTNLVNWIPLFTNTASGSPFYFFDPATRTNFPGRFYRARVP